MTLEDVRQAKQALEAEGAKVSYDAVLIRLGAGSKRDVARYMRTLKAGRDAPAPADTPEPITAPTPPPVSRVTALEAELTALAQRETAAREERDATHTRYLQTIEDRRGFLWAERFIEAQTALATMHRLERQLKDLDDLLPTLTDAQDATRAALDAARRARTARETAHWRHVQGRLDEIALDGLDRMRLQWVCALKFGHASWPSLDHRQPSQFERPVLWARIEAAFPFLDTAEEVSV